MPKIKIDKADKFFSLWVRTRDDWTCQRCHKQYAPPTSALHCSHFVGRAKENTRFNPLNATALCYGCHSYLGSHPVEHYEFQTKRIGEDKVNNLRLWSSVYKKKDRQSEALYWEQRLKEDFGIGNQEK